MSGAKEVLSKDPVMKRLIEKYGELSLPENNGHKDYFSQLVSNIISQQLSNKAAETICRRVFALIGENPVPDTVLSAQDEALRSCGMSFNKIKYIKSLAQAAHNKTLDLENINGYGSEDIIAQLTSVKGIGRWTAEMFLIFSLSKPDVYSLGDGGLASALNRLYGNGEALKKDEILKISDSWKPYRSIASLYLWRSLENQYEK